MAPTYSQHTDPTPDQLLAFMATFPPICGAEGAPGAPAAAGEGGGGGQGEGVASDSGSDGLYDLESVPAELREHVSPILKNIEGNVTKRFQEAADFRKTWEPYADLGVSDVAPETMEQVLNWLEMTNDPAQYRSWLEAQAQQAGLLQAGGAGNDDDDVDLGGFEGLDEGQVMTREQFQKELEAFKAEQKAEHELTVAQQQTERELNARFDTLSQELGLSELEEDKRRVHENAIWAIAQSQYSGDQDPVGKAFADYKALIGQTETDLLRRKLNVPAPPEGGGGAPDTSVARPKTIAEASQLMRGRLRQQQTA